MKGFGIDLDEGRSVGVYPDEDGGFLIELKRHKWKGDPKEDVVFGSCGIIIEKEKTVHQIPITRDAALALHQLLSHYIREQVKTTVS